MPNLDLGKIVGTDGEDGVTPTLSVKSTTTLAAGQNARVEVDSSSTTSNILLNFFIPKGADGDVSAMSANTYDPNNHATDIFAYADTVGKTGDMTGVRKAVSPALANLGIRNVYFGNGEPSAAVGLTGDIYIRQGGYDGATNLSSKSVGDSVYLEENGENVEYLYLGTHFGTESLLLRKYVEKQSHAEAISFSSTPSADYYTYSKVKENSSQYQVTRTSTYNIVGSTTEPTKLPESQQYSLASTESKPVSQWFSATGDSMWALSNDGRTSTHIVCLSISGTEYSTACTAYTMSETTDSAQVAPSPGWNGSTYIYNIQPHSTGGGNTEVNPSNRYVGSSADHFCNDILPNRFSDFVKSKLVNVSLPSVFGDGNAASNNYKRRGFILSATELGLACPVTEGVAITGIGSISAPYIENGNTAVNYSTRTPAADHKRYYVSGNTAYAGSLKEFNFALRPCIAIDGNAKVDSSSKISGGFTEIWVKDGTWRKA